MSDTKVNLPKTQLGMKANLPTKEPELLKFWSEINLYDNLRSNSLTKEKFVLHDGPPYANGNIHIGTALNKILKDIIIRYQQMSGKNAVYVPGWDCHGLPIEWKIEEEYKKKGKNKKNISIIEFRKECRDFASSWIAKQKDQFKRLGVEGDWKNPYMTMSKEAEAQIAVEILKFLQNGGLYNGYKPVLWSVVEATALADAEVEYADHKSNTIFTKFPIQGKLEELDDVKIIIWTTTPWTIPCNRALAFNSNYEYSILEVLQNDKKEKILVATQLVEQVLKECNISDYKILHSLKGAKLSGAKCYHPFKKYGYDFDVPLLDAEFVTLEQGTGIVHIAPSHGPDDFNLGLKNNIRAENTIDDNGYYTNVIKKFEGIHIFKADKIIIEELQVNNSLLGSGTLLHSYPHSWRSKAPLVHRATPQWFISMDTNELRNISLKAIDNTIFYPAVGKNRLRSMIETRPDWCISRQRFWGVPIPIFVHKKTGKPLVDKEVFEKIEEIFKQEGSDAWFTKKSQDFLGSKYNENDFTKVNDIVEVWFDSGSTHSYVLEKREDLKWPADMYLEGSDQHRGWFHSSLLHSCGTRGRAPYKSILCHGFVVDGKGQKMSKSLGNVISPDDVIKKYGADILRLWVVASDYSDDLKIDDSILEQHSQSYRKIRNTFRFLLGNLNDTANLDVEVNEQELEEIEKYILHKVSSLDKAFTGLNTKYELHKIYVDLLNFCTVDLSAFYFDIRKDILYCDDLNSKKRINCITVLSIVLKFLLKWFSPILVFTCEEIYQIIKKNNSKESIFLCDFPKFPEQWFNEKINEKWIFLKTLRSEINNYIEQKRNEKIIGSGLECSVHISLDNKYNTYLSNIDLAELFICSEVTIDNKEKKFQEIKSEGSIDTLKVIVEKAEGSKCTHCWKVLKNKCYRNNCGIN
ncbi:isoleucine--tRNA ligase [Pelagibacteraceae bacterium]|nr:isoleucine--tRNA ligase [Pelagibacteraceae bacterium]